MVDSRCEWRNEIVSRSEHLQYAKFLLGRDNAWYEEMQEECNTVLQPSSLRLKVLEVNVKMSFAWTKFYCDSSTVLVHSVLRQYSE